MIRNDRLRAQVRGTGVKRHLEVRAIDATMLQDFEGELKQDGEEVILTGPPNGHNAATARDAFPALQPRPMDRRGRSVGTGDRLGLATPGHVRAFKRHGGGTTPFFAQQSIREMDRLERSAQSVLDDATFGCIQGGWTTAVGADTDHIKTTEGIDRGLAAGFTTFTLDPGDHVVDVRGGVSGQQLAQVPWDDLAVDRAGLVSRYVGRVVDTGSEHYLFSENDVLGAAVKYGSALAHTARLSRHLAEHAKRQVAIEVAIDESDFVTSFAEHDFLAREMTRLGIEWVSFAPRYADGFEKGVEYLGDVAALEMNLRGHAAIAAQHGGYKISLHSGSDKFSIYEMAVAATGGDVHLKTSGTSYLCALDVAAVRAPDLFREIYGRSRDAYRRARASYQVSADIAKTPDPADVADNSLDELVHQFDARQILHVGYGDALTAVDATGERYLDAALRGVLAQFAEEYAEKLAKHIGQHISPLAQR